VVDDHGHFLYYADRMEDPGDVGNCVYYPPQSEAGEECKVYETKGDDGSCTRCPYGELAVDNVCTVSELKDEKCAGEEYSNMETGFECKKCEGMSTPQLTFRDVCVLDDHGHHAAVQVITCHCLSRINPNGGCIPCPVGQV